jgi:AcrR family transcriptional regulator
MSNIKSDIKYRRDGQLTRKRILDASEKLFSIEGYSGVSLRSITNEAGVDLALIKYYFGSKQGLFDEVLSRRVDKMSSERLAMLNEVRVIENSHETITQLLSVFLQPMLGDTKAQMKELRNYRLLIALVTNSKNWQHEIFKQHYDPVAVRFIETLAKALPEASWEDVCWSFSFFLGSTVNAFAETGRIDRLSGGKCRSADLREACSQLIQYSVASFLSLPRRAKKTE